MYQNIIGKPTETSYTDVEGIKEGSFHYVEQVNEEGNLRYGSVISSYVEFEVYENNPSFAVGDELYYIQRTDQSKTFEDGAIRNIKINTFIVKTVEKFKTTYKYTAYDYISKLDVDVSSELLALKDSFPLTAAIILSSYISHWCSIRIDWSSLYWYTGSNTYVPTIPFFYYNGITARDIVARLAELNSQFVVAVQHQGYVQIEFQSSTGYSNWDSLSNMIICPTDLIDYYGTGSQSETKLIPIWYKENGLNKADYTCAVLNRAIIRRNSGEIVYDSDDDAWQPLPSGDNVYTIYGNYIAESLYDAGTSGINMFYSCRANVARILNYNITPMTVKLFPFRNPYRAGNIIQNMADADGNRFASFAMKMEITDESATLYCYGDEKYQPYSGDDISSLRASVESNIEEVRDGKVSKSGDTMTGNLTIEEANNGQIHIKADDITMETAPSGNKYLGQCQFVDSNDEMFGWLSNMYTGGRQVQTRLGARNINESTSEIVDNQLILAVRNNGERLVTVTDSAPWRTALGAVNKAGDTMTGDLNVDRKEATNGFGRLRLIGNRKAKAGTDDAGTSNRPFGGIYIYDGSTDGNGPNDEYNVFYNECTLHAKDNRVYTSYVVRRLLANGTAASNGFYVGVNTDGSSHVSFAGGGKKAWLAALLEPVTITPTIPSALPTGVTAIGYIHVTQSGYVVEVDGYVTRNTVDNGSNWFNLASGLPAPLIQNSTSKYWVIPTSGTLASSARSLYLKISSTGNLAFAYGQAASSTSGYRFTLTYIAANLDKI